MPFPISHLMIGYEIMQQTDRIKNPYEFMLGSIAPDAVHHRPDFERSLKSKSHLCVGEEPWGMVTRNEWWHQNILDFLEANKNHPNIDFIYGYCAHVLTDLQNNIKIWIPFRTNNGFTVGKGLSSRYHEESDKIDLELYHRPSRVEIWEILNRNDAVDCSMTDAFEYEDLEKIKNHLLTVQYVGRERQSLVGNTYVTMEVIDRFIEEAVQDIIETVYKK